MQPIVVEYGGLQTAVADAIVTAISIPSAGPLTLDGTLVIDGVAIIYPPACLSVTSDGDDTSISFTITGKDESGRDVTFAVPQGPNTETLPLSDGPAFSVVTSIVASDGSNGNISFGIIEESYSRMIALDPYAYADTMYQVSKISGTLTTTVEGTLDDPNSLSNPIPISDVKWNSNYSPINAEAGSDMKASTWTPLYVRLYFTGTGVGRFTVMQFGSVTK